MPIKPTPGRIVWYRPGAAHAQDLGLPNDSDAPLAAIVAAVPETEEGEGGRVNLCVIMVDGSMHPRIDVPLLQDDDEPPEDGGDYCEWMPYQKATASGQESPKLHSDSDTRERNERDSTEGGS